ncbi:hypothetical protein N8385_01605 [Cyclobacteriaceae bacterium]|nr:hypothetical protein [Cyclobacteriaceae bacterium]
MFNFNYSQMKKNIKSTVQNLKSKIIIIAMIMFCMSCQETMITKDFTSDLDLIAAIQKAENKVIISNNSLPQESKNSISSNYVNNYISKSAWAPELGYQVDLRKHKGRQVANKSVAYFDIDGRMLIADEDFKAKKGGRGGKKRMGNKGALEDCFDFFYPFTLVMPDVSEIEISDIEGWDLVKAWYEVNPEEEERPIFVFPLNILVEESEMTINDEDEFKAIAEGCKNSKGRDGKGGDCFEVVYPFTLTMPDSTLVTLESDDDRAVVKAWHDAHPEVKEKGVFVFPINILFDGIEMTISDEGELKAIAEGCKNGNDRDAKRGDCFEIVYPFTLKMPDSTFITLESDVDRAAVKAWHDAHLGVREKGVFVFPISLEYPDGERVEIDSKEDFEQIKKDC